MTQLSWPRALLSGLQGHSFVPFQHVSEGLLDCSSAGKNSFVKTDHVKGITLATASNSEALHGHSAAFSLPTKRLASKPSQ